MTRTLPIVFALALCACPPAETSVPIPPNLKLSSAPHWPARQAPIGVGAGRVYVTNSLDDTLSVIDLASVGDGGLVELDRAPVGLSPVEIEGLHHAAIDPAGTFLYVALSNFAPGTGSGPHGAHGTGTIDGSLLKIDVNDLRVVGSVRVDRNPGELTLSPDARTVFVSHFDQQRIVEVQQRGGTIAEMASRIAIIDAASMTRTAMVPVCPAAHGLRPSADGTRLYVACQSDELAIVRLDLPGHPVTRVALTSRAGDPLSATHLPYALAVSPTSGEVWVSCLSGEDVHVVDPVAGRLVRTIPIGGGVVFGDFTPDGKTFFLPHNGDDQVSVFDTATYSRTRDLPLAPGGCLNLHQVVVAPGGRHLLAVCEGNHRLPGSVHAWDLAADALVQSAPVGVYPDFIGVLRGAR